MYILTPWKLPHPEVISAVENETHTDFCCLSCLSSDASQARPGMTAWYSLIPLYISSCLKETLGSSSPASSRAKIKVKRGGQGLCP